MGNTYLVRLSLRIKLSVENEPKQVEVRSKNPNETNPALVVFLFAADSRERSGRSCQVKPFKFQISSVAVDGQVDEMNTQSFIAEKTIEFKLVLNESRVSTTADAAEQLEDESIPLSVSSPKRCVYLHLANKQSQSTN